MDEKEFEKSFLDFYRSKAVRVHAGNVSRSLVGGLGESDAILEADEAVLVATANLWEKLKAGEIPMPEKFHNMRGFWMERYKWEIRNYLLTRYERRSNTKPTDQYEKEKQAFKAAGITGQKVTKYQGARFELSEDEMLANEKQLTPEDRLIFDSEKESYLRQALTDLGLEQQLVDVIIMRNYGMTFNEIGYKLDKSGDAVRMKFNADIGKAVEAGLSREQVLALEYGRNGTPDTL